MSGTVAIYALCEFPDLGAVRYVGQSVDPKQRLRSHVSAHRENNHKHGWISRVLSCGGAVGCLVIEWVQPEMAGAAERYWIGELRARGYQLTNGALLHGPGQEYKPGADFDPLRSTVLLTQPHRFAMEWRPESRVWWVRAVATSDKQQPAAQGERP